MCGAEIGVVVKKIQTEAENEAALERIEVLMSSSHPLEASEEKELAQLIRVVSVFEDEYYPIGLPTEEAARHFRADQESCGRRWDSEG